MSDWVGVSGWVCQTGCGHLILLTPRVLNVLRHWVENHYYDFEQDPADLNHLKTFVGTVKAKNVQKWVSSIHRALAKVCACDYWSCDYWLP